MKNELNKATRLLKAIREKTLTFRKVWKHLARNTMLVVQLSTHLSFKSSLSYFKLSFRCIVGAHACMM